MCYGEILPLSMQRTTPRFRGTTGPERRNVVMIDAFNACEDVRFSTKQRPKPVGKSEHRVWRGAAREISCDRVSVHGPP
jgi:hypothetical protein